MTRTKNCEDCPFKIEREKLKEKYEDELFKAIGARSAKFRFEKMLGVMFFTANSEEMPKDKMSVKTAELLTVYLSEKTRAENIKEALVAPR